MKCLLVAVLLLLQDQELDRLVQQLGDADPARREEAVRKIREIGPRAHEALEKARESSDSEVRARATALLQHFERERLQTLLEAKERQKIFPRITIDVADAPLDSVLEELSRQSGWVWDTKELQLNRRVTLKGMDLPMIEALERIGLHRSFSLFGKVCLDEAKPAPLAVFTDGVRFSFSRRSWSPKGESLGTVFETEKKDTFEGETTKWSVASIKTDRDLAVETCAIHSPNRVYVATPVLMDPRVTVKGARLWYCPTPIEFAEPKNGDVWRVGACQVIVDWPSISIRMDNPLEERLLKRTLSDKDINFKAKPGREKKEEMGVGIGGGGGGRYGGRFGGKNLAWCGCQDHPATERPNLWPMAKDFSVKIAFGELYAIGDIATISITLHKPVEDSFELTSSPLK
jgi:hypothetical protein